MTNAIKVLLQIPSGFLQLESTLQETYFLEHSKRAFVNIYLTWQNSIPLRYIK
jgi:hypothetical protein